MSNKSPAVLICDDRESQYNKIRRFLEGEGYECEPRVEREDEVRKLLQNSYRPGGRFYHAVMLDVDLKTKNGGRNGIQLYKSLSTEFPNEDYIIYSTQQTRQLRDQINELRFQDVQIVLLDEITREQDLGIAFVRLFDRGDHERVFLVNGRNEEKNRMMTKFLQVGLGLAVVSWEEAKAKSRSEFIFDIVVAGMQNTAATVVLFTDDEDVKLRQGSANAREKGRRTQSRPNVYLEAGYAMGIRRKRTVFVEWPNNESEFSQPSDLHGMHMVRFTGSAKSRGDLKSRLAAARCLLRPDAKWKSLKL